MKTNIRKISLVILLAFQKMQMVNLLNYYQKMASIT